MNVPILYAVILFTAVISVLFEGENLQELKRGLARLRYGLWQLGVQIRTPFVYLLVFILSLPILFDRHPADQKPSEGIEWYNLLLAILGSALLVVLAAIAEGGLFVSRIGRRIWTVPVVRKVANIFFWFVLAMIFLVGFVVGLLLNVPEIPGLIKEGAIKRRLA